MSCLAKLGATIPFDPQHAFVTSPVLSALPLAIVRLVMAFYALFTIVFILAWELNVTHVDTYFSYFTHFSLIGLCAYLFAASVQTFFYFNRKGQGYPLQSWPRALQFLHVLLHSTIITFPLLVTIVYWALIASKRTFASRFSTWSNISQHALNSVFALFEILFTRARPSPWLHLVFLILILACYVAVAYITHATQGFYPYNFLDPKKQGSKLAAYIIGIGVAEIIVFLFVRGVVVVRERLLSRSSRATPSPAVSKFEDGWVNVDRAQSPMAPTAI